MAAQPAASEPGDARGVCTPCRGTGSVISNIGGTAHPVTCPWCGGSGRVVAGRDPQEAPAEAAPG